MNITLRQLARESKLAIPTIRSYLTGSSVCMHPEKLQKLANTITKLSSTETTPRDIVAGAASTNRVIRGLVRRLR